MAKQPIKLEDDPILETIFEVRFSGKIAQVADLLPGLLFEKIRNDYPHIETLEVISQDVLDANPGLKYKATKRMSGKYCALQVGEKVINIVCGRPYQGWEVVQNSILSLLSALESVDVIDQIERFSLKYVNLLPEDEGMSGLSKLRLSLSLGDIDLSGNSSGFQLRTEIIKNDFVNIVTILANAKAKLPGNEEISGMIVDIDTIYQGQIGSINDIKELLNRCHDTEKEIFFSIATADTINELKPVWG